MFVFFRKRKKRNALLSGKSSGSIAEETPVSRSGKYVKIDIYICYICYICVYNQYEMGGRVID
jgi:hypothetical protein